MTYGYDDASVRRDDCSRCYWWQESQREADHRARRYLQLKAAPDVAQCELEQFLASKRDWIYRKLAEKETLTCDPVIKELVNGEGYLYLGRSYQLRIVETDDRRVRLQRGKLILPRSLVNSGFEQIVNWYCVTGLAWLKPREKDWACRLRLILGQSKLPTSATSGDRRCPVVACASIGPRCNYALRLWSTFWRMSLHIFARPTMGRRSGNCSVGRCRTSTSVSLSWPLLDQLYGRELSEGRS